MLLSILAHYPWALGVLLGDVHPSELERLDEHCLCLSENPTCDPSDLQSTTQTTRLFRNPKVVLVSKIIIVFIFTHEKYLLSVPITPQKIFMWPNEEPYSLARFISTQN